MDLRLWAALHKSGAAAVKKQSRILIFVGLNILLCAQNKYLFAHRVTFRLQHQSLQLFMHLALAQT